MFEMTSSLGAGAHNKEGYCCIADLVEAVRESVVSIEVVDRYTDELSGVTETFSIGSGFTVKEDGLILTNAHVVASHGESSIRVKMFDGRILTGYIETMAFEYDLATIRVNDTGLTVARLGNRSATRVGDTVITIGSPMGLANTVTCGIVSAFRQGTEMEYPAMDITYIQTTALTARGNSGGPVFNSGGEVIGIHTIGHTYGFSFAIPITYAITLLANNFKSDETETEQSNMGESIPVVLMDGAYETHKIATVKSRFDSAVRDYVKRDPFPGKTYTPVFLKTVFLEVLAEQKIPCFQTMGEADCTIAYIAHLLGDCYILSSDSDFFVYINSKAILLKSLKFAKATAPKAALEKEDNNHVATPSKVWTLQAQYVSIHRLCDEEFQMKDRRLLPLAAVILGKDYIHSKAFKSFQALKTNGNCHTSSGRIESIMKWLGRKQTVQVGIDALVRLVAESKKESTTSSINKIVSMYEGMDGERRVWSALKANLDLSKWISEEERNLEDRCNGDKEGKPVTERQDSSLANDEVTEEELDHLMRATVSALLGNGSGDVYQKANFEQKLAKLEAKICDSVLPNWYLEEHTSCELQSYLLNLYKNHLVIFNPQVEWFEDNSCHELSIPIISFTAGILLCDEAYNFYVLTRIKGHMETKTLYPVTKLPIFGELPKLFIGTAANAEFRKQLTCEKKLGIMSETLFGDNSDLRNYVQRWPASYRIWLECLLHYVKKKDACKTFQKREIVAIAVSIFLCVFKNLLVNPSDQTSKSTKASSASKDDNPNLTTFQQAIKCCSEKLKNVRALYQKYADFAEETGEKFQKAYDMRISYALSEYLCLVFHTEMLNSLLDKPYKSPKVRCTINNFFMYNLSEALMTTALQAEAKVEDVAAAFTSSFCKVEEMSPMIKDFVDLCMKLLNF